MMTGSTRLRIVMASMVAVALLVGTFAVPGVVVQAAKGGSCGAFTAILSDGTRYAGEQDRVIPAAKVNGKTLLAKGRYVEYTVNLNTFAVTNYLLTGAPSDRDITGGKRTVIFASKTPQHGTTLTGPLTLELKDETLQLERAGQTIDLKIQSKDCAQGGLFQMEPEPGVTMRHVLAPGFTYYTDNLGRTLFTNGTVVGRESPEAASLVGRTATTSRWQVASGGRMGGVLGEDATQP